MLYALLALPIVALLTVLLCMLAYAGERRGRWPR